MFRNPRVVCLSCTIVLSLCLALIIGLAGNVPTGNAQGPILPLDEPLGTAFTYQGFLVRDGQYWDGRCDFEFNLFNVSTGGLPIADPVFLEGVEVKNGYFTVKLDFGLDAIKGTRRWLQIGVNCDSNTDGIITLEPRQELTPTPSALALPGLWTQPYDAEGTDLTGGPNLIGGYHLNNVATGAEGAVIGGGGALTLDLPAPWPYPESVADGTILTNQVTSSYGVVGGGLGNTAGLLSTVDGGAINTAAGPGVAIGGGALNTASGLGATIGGGYTNLIEADGEYAVIGGGEYNTASYTGTTVSGGSYNTASRYWATVGGGADNMASGDGATIAGGGHNRAGGFAAAVGGGEYNIAGDGSPGIPEALGDYATIPGGYQNSAFGNYSFAAGQGAAANHQGSFVWSDATTTTTASTGDNQFIVRAAGGLWFGSNGTVNIRNEAFIDTDTGAYLSKGGTWTNVSDRALKSNFAPVDGRAVLEGLVDLPIMTWNYINEGTDTRHIGPTAQDFYAAFRLGNSDTTIATVDADGIALAAIQGLYQITQDQQQQIALLQRQNAELAARLTALETLLQAGGAK